MSELFGSAQEELEMIRTIVAKTLDAKIFIDAVERIGFRFEEESSMGLLLETNHSRVLVKVKNSTHPLHMASLLHLNKDNDEQTLLVVDGATAF